LVALAVAAAPASAQVTPPTQAFILTLLGDLAGARVALAASPAGHPGAAVVSVCVELEAGDFAAADARLQALQRIRPAPPEAAVLRALVARRRAAPAEPMTVALAEAWRAAGSPDLSGGDLVALWPKAVLRMLFPLPDATSVARLSAGEAFLLGPVLAPRPDGDEAIDLAWFDEHSTGAAALAADPAANSTAVNLALLSWWLEPRDRAPVLAELRRRLPDDAVMAVIVALRDGSDLEEPEAPLSAAEVEAIESAVRKPSWTSTTDLIFAEISALTRRVAPAHAALHARIAHLFVVRLPLLPIHMVYRAQATVDPALRARAAAALAAAAGGLKGSGALLDRMIGLSFAKAALELQGDAAGAERISDEARAWLRRLEEPRRRLALHAWPLPSLWREWRPQDEVVTLERLAR